MANIFFLFGVASVEILLIFTLIYLQNEIDIISNIVRRIPSKLLTIIGMMFSFVLIIFNILSTKQISTIMISIILIITLSLTVNYTYTDYTIDEGYYITIPYFIIYLCFLFMISINECPLFTIEYLDFYIILLCSFLCYILFSISTFLGIEFHRSHLNYIAFIGLVITSLNVILIINYSKTNSMTYIINFLTLQFIHIYLYLAHLLSVQFEINI